MSERQKSWWETDVPRVLQESEDLYARAVEIDPSKNKIALTKSKIVPLRKWETTQKLFEKDFDRVLKQLGFFYVPKQVIPGPAFVFPIHDVDGKVVRAQTKPLEGSVLYSEKSKYRFIGEKPMGPSWLGNDHITLQQIINTRKVVVVEGPFDLLAAKLMCPDIPILSPLTKTLGKQHIPYLQMLGVRDIVLMYDNEQASVRNDVQMKEGAGYMSMRQQVATIKVMNAKLLPCPMSDPSDCLTNPIYAQKLRTRILAEF